jgi:hypothetical protein
MDLDIDSLIIRPGMFVVDPDKRYRVTGQEEPEGKKLDIFKDKELAHSVYQAYAMCHNNAVDLISDAEILLAAGKYARSCALAIMAWEELGKSQIAADYYSGMLTDREYSCPGDSCQNGQATLGSKHKVSSYIRTWQRLAPSASVLNQSKAFLLFLHHSFTSASNVVQSATHSRMSPGFNFIDSTDILRRG